MNDCFKVELTFKFYIFLLQLQWEKTNGKNDICDKSRKEKSKNKKQIYMNVKNLHKIKQNVILNLCDFANYRVTAYTKTYENLAVPFSKALERQHFQMLLNTF